MNEKITYEQALDFYSKQEEPPAIFIDLEKFVIGYSKKHGQCYIPVVIAWGHSFIKDFEKIHQNDLEKGIDNPNVQECKGTLFVSIESIRRAKEAVPNTGLPLKTLNKLEKLIKEAVQDYGYPIG
jgi:hypothetical protein